MTRFPILHIFAYVLLSFACQFTLELPKWSYLNYIKLVYGFLNTPLNYLILVNVPRQFSLAQLVKSDDDQSHEDVDEKEREDDEIDDIKNGHFHSEHWDRAFIFVSGGHRVLEDGHPTFGGLHSEQSHHGACAVVIVEVFDLPKSRLYNWDMRTVFASHKKFAPET